MAEAFARYRGFKLVSHLFLGLTPQALCSTPASQASTFCRAPMNRIFCVLIAVASFALPLRGQDGARLEQVLNNGFTYRNLGPFRVSAWVSDIAVPETPTKTHLYT